MMSSVIISDWAVSQRLQVGAVNGVMGLSSLASTSSLLSLQVNVHMPWLNVTHCSDRVVRLYASCFWQSLRTTLFSFSRKWKCYRTAPFLWDHLSPTFHFAVITCEVNMPMCSPPPLSFNPVVLTLVMDARFLWSKFWSGRHDIAVQIIWICNLKVYMNKIVGLT